MTMSYVRLDAVDSSMASISSKEETGTLSVPVPLIIADVISISARWRACETLKMPNGMDEISKHGLP